MMRKDNYKDLCEYWRLKTLETDFEETLRGPGAARI